uniref:Uncharacterized protein n=1 Tax=viral metagenome TaxID=1070528 RepID=A0A6C0ED16_9ZZZZ
MEGDEIVERVAKLTYELTLIMDLCVNIRRRLLARGIIKQMSKYSLRDDTDAISIFTPYELIKKWKIFTEMSNSIINAKLNNSYVETTYGDLVDFSKRIDSEIEMYDLCAYKGTGWR